MAETLRARPAVTVQFLKAIKSSLDEMLAEPLAPLVTRAAKDFDIPGAADLDLSIAMLDAMIKEEILSEGKANVMLNIPRLWQEGCAALRDAGIVDVKDASVLYTNTFVDKALAG